MKLSTQHLSGAAKTFGFGLIVGLLGILASSMPFSLRMEEKMGLQLLFALRGACSPHQVLDLIGPDGPSMFYLKLCDSYCQTPPEADWDGTIYLKQK